MALRHEKGAKLYSAMREELDAAERGLGWSGTDLHELFDCFDYGREENVEGAFVRYDRSHPELNMIVPAMDPLADNIIAQALYLIDETMYRRSGQSGEGG